MKCQILLLKHVILNKMTPGPDQSVSIDFTELHQLVEGCNKVFLAMGNEKKVRKREEAIRAWAFRSIVSTCDIEPGEEITQNKIWSKRPGTGIPSYLMDKVIGLKAISAIKKNTLVKAEDLGTTIENLKR